MRAVSVVCLLALALAPAANGGFLDKGKDLAVLAKDVTVGVAEKIPDAIPSFDDIVDFSKQTFAGLPFQAALSAFNKICKYLS